MKKIESIQELQKVVYEYEKVSDICKALKVAIDDKNWMGIRLPGGADFRADPEVKFMTYNFYKERLAELEETMLSLLCQEIKEED